MSIQVTPYMLPFLVAAVVALVISAFAWYREMIGGARIFSLLMAFVAWNCVNSVLFLGSTTLRAFFFWIKVSFLCGALGVLWLIFARLYTGYDRTRTLKLAAWLSLEPVLMFVLAWTNDLHHLLWSGERLIGRTAGGIMLRVGFTFGPLFWVWTAYQYVLLVAGAILLVQGLAHGVKAYRGQLVMVLSAMIVPWLANVIFLIERSPVDMTPLAYAVSSTILFFALFRFHFLDLVPVMHSFVLEASPNGVLVLDIKDRIVDVNPAAERLLGRPAQEILGRPGVQFLPELAPLNDRSMQECTRIVEGQERVYSISVVSLRRRSGRLIVLDDITERKRISLQLMQVQKMDALGLMAGGIAHDFNNLLTGILGNISMLRREEMLTPPASDLLSQAEQAAGEAARLTRSLLAFSRTGRVSPAVTNLNGVLETTVQALGKMMPETVALHRSCDPALWHVFIDPAQLTQILMNLALNACDAMNSKGTISVRTANAVLDDTFAAVHPGAGTGDYVLLSVSDTGEGMTENVRQHLFEPFFTTKPLGHGTGLGLSVVYGAVQQAGGWISVESALGRGSTFSLYFPRCSDSLAVAPVATGSPEIPGGHETVLVVDDEQMILQLAARMLRHCGYTVLTAPDGPAALALLQSRAVTVDLIILDMTMPGMSGGQVLRQLRSGGVAVPVLVSSGYAPAGDPQEPEDLPGGADGFLPKPYDLQELAITVRRSLDAVVARSSAAAEAHQPQEILQ